MEVMAALEEDEVSCSEVTGDEDSASFITFFTRESSSLSDLMPFFLEILGSSGGTRSQADEEAPSSPSVAQVKSKMSSSGGEGSWNSCGLGGESALASPDGDGSLGFSDG